MTVQAIYLFICKTVHYRLASSIAVSLPIPFDAPVIITVRPRRSSSWHNFAQSHLQCLMSNFLITYMIMLKLPVKRINPLINPITTEDTRFATSSIMIRFYLFVHKISK